MTEEHTAADESLAPGEPVYDDRGRLIGYVTRLTGGGFEAEIAAADEEKGGEDDEEVIPGKEFGEGYLMWRCGECGEMGDLDDGMPTTCPECGASREAISPAKED